METISKILKHPLTLMVLGFGLTTLLGNAYVNKLHIKEFETKQKIMYKEKLIDKQITLSEEMILPLMRYISVVNKIYAIYYYDTPGVEVNDLKDELRNTDWNKKKNLIKYKSKIYFRSDSIETYLNEIDDILYKGAGSNNYQLIRLLSKRPKEFAKEKKVRDSIFKQIVKNRNQIEIRLNRILETMRSEIQNFEKDVLSEN